MENVHILTLDDQRVLQNPKTILKMAKLICYSPKETEEDRMFWEIAVSINQLSIKDKFSFSWNQLL